MSLRSRYTMLAPALRRLLEATPFHFFSWHHRWAVNRAFRSGPPYQPARRRIIIDLTESCDLGCVDCSRSCGSDQAPSAGLLTIEQIEKFIDESSVQKRSWEIIQLEGGEPTLHPHLEEIIALLVDAFSPAAVIQVNTNGYSAKSRHLAVNPPKNVQIYCSAKTGRQHPDHLPFNLAPADDPANSHLDYRHGCFLPALYGLGLTRFGYYPHPNCGAIDRVFGFDVGRKTLPQAGEPLSEQFPALCRYCGLFCHFNRTAASRLKKSGPLGRRVSAQPNAGTISSSWNEAYRRYSRDPVDLTLYR